MNRKSFIKTMFGLGAISALPVIAKGEYGRKGDKVTMNVNDADSHDYVAVLRLEDTRSGETWRYSARMNADEVRSNPRMALKVFSHIGGYGTAHVVLSKEGVLERSF